MADALQKTVGVLNVEACYDGGGNATALKVWYLVTLTDQTSGQTWTVTEGPRDLDITQYTSLLASILAAMPVSNG